MRTWRVYEMFYARTQQRVMNVILFIYTMFVFLLGMALGYAIK